MCETKASELASALALHPFFRSITAPMALAQSQPQVIVQESKELKEIIARLNERLDEPFVTAGTVTGDKGIKQAQDEYQRLMNNKIVIQRAQCHACMSIAERERFIKISEIQKKMSV